jgi:uncharacterized membrane protein
MVEVTLFGPIDQVLGYPVPPAENPVIVYVLLVLGLVNLVTRWRAHAQHVRQAANEDEAITRHRGHVAANVLLLVGSFYYMTLHAHGGMVLSVLVLTVVLTDVFEFESRKVEARQELELERPNAGMAAAALVVAYAAFNSIFFVVAPVWNAIV